MSEFPYVGPVDNAQEFLDRVVENAVSAQGGKTLSSDFVNARYFIAGADRHELDCRHASLLLSIRNTKALESIAHSLEKLADK